MVDKDKIIEEFGLDRFSPEEQDVFYEDFTYELGAAISDGLTDEQMTEFTEIINGNEPVIQQWLGANAPGYRDDPTYQELAVGVNEDPERVAPEKVFASIAWVRVNRPDYDQIVAGVKREFKRALEAHARP